MRISPLARIGFVLYALLVVGASLYPMEGWTDAGLGAFAYLFAPWPRRLIGADIVLNIVGYLPYGMLGVPALLPRLRGLCSFIAVVLSALALSIGLEALQTYLPTRFASNVDVLCNFAGAAIGALLALIIGPRRLLEGPLDRLRKAFHAGPLTDLGLVLLVLWLFTQLNPGALAFGTGDLREFLGARDPQGERAHFFMGVEAATTASNVAAVGLLLSALSVPGARARAGMVALFLGALAAKTLTFAIVVQSQDAFAWLTPGARVGLVAGLVFALAAASMPRLARLAAAAMLVMAATVLVNLAPANPYLAASAWPPQHAQFLNFNGLTRAVSALWPFAALGYLMVLAARRSRDSP